MATSVMQKQKTGSWSAIFPTQQVTQQQSALFVKKLLAVAISNITYLRTIFPEHAFGDRCLEDLSLKILRDDSACPGACQVIQWVKGCFDALDRKYLRMITVGIFVDADDPMTAVETYSFKFDYNDQKGITIFRNDKQVASAFSEVETKRATIKLLRTIIVLTQTLQPLPDDVMMTMKLYYYDDVTPEDYEPPGFQPTNPHDFEFEDSAVNIKIGDVSTPFHSEALPSFQNNRRARLDPPLLFSSLGTFSVKLRIKTGSSQFTPSNEFLEQLKEEVASGKGGVAQNKGGVAPTNKPVDIGTEAMDTSATGQSTGDAHEPTEQEKSTARLKPAALDTPAPPPNDLCPPHKMYKSEDNIVHCPCGVNEDDGLMVLCALCQVWQHAVCFGFLEEDKVPEQHVCIECAARHRERQCTDPSLSQLKPEQVQSVCLWRRTLHACCDLSRLVTPGLARRLGVAQGVAQAIMERLEKEGYLRPQAKGKKWGRVILKDKLVNEGLPKYFKPHPPPAAASHQDKPATRNKCPDSQNQCPNVEGCPKEQDTPQNQDTLKPKQNSSPTNKPHPPVSGLEHITDQAADLSISKLQKSVLQVAKEEVEVRRSPRIRAKRVRSVMDENKEFELSCSQDPDDVSGAAAAAREAGLGEGHRKKRRKASIASTSIMV